MNKKFSIKNRIKSANHAWRGIGLLIKTSHNSLGLGVVGLLAIYLGFILEISTTEWMFVVFSIGLVLITETLNSALEVDINLTSPDYHPYARDTKDLAAAAVMLSTILAGIVGLIIFLPKIINMLEYSHV